MPPRAAKPLPAENRRQAQVHHFAWCDDFAAARNAALARSPAVWNLILDADKRLAQDAAGAQALVEGTRGPATAIGLLPGAWNRRGSISSWRGRCAKCPIHA
jgi:hypothetical protein